MKKIIIASLSVILLTMGALYFLTNTTKGSSLAFMSVLKGYVSDDQIKVGDENGDFLGGFSIENIEIENIRNLPQGSKIRIQKLWIKTTSIGIDGVALKIENLRVLLPESSPILIAGHLENGNLDFNIFSRGVGINEILGYLPDFKGLVPISGDVEEIDLYIKEHYLNPRVQGQLVIKEFLYKGFLLKQSPIKLDVKLKEKRNDVQLFGKVNIDGGILQAQKSSIQDIKGFIHFSGDWDKPEFNITGRSKVEKAKIDIRLRGTLEDPKLSLTSEPPYSQQKLMVMLATGKTWQSIESAIDTGVVSSTEITRDFIDYYFFAGNKNSFAKKLGLNDFSVKFNKDTRGIEAKKSITDRLDVGYGVEQKIKTEGDKTTSQKLQGEYQVTDKVSVGVEREIKKTQSLDELDPKQEAVNDDKVYIKYKKSF